MFRKTLFAPLLAATAMALTVTPAYAGKADRAREAIAAAEAKIHTAETMGAGTALPREAAEARATVARAKENLERGNKTTSIDQAIQASAMADTAIGILQRDKENQVAAANASREMDVAAANQQAAAAQNQAADANARASMAERSAAASAAEAQAARMAAQTPAEVETTVTTQQPAAAAPRRAARTVTRKTTTAKRVVAPAPTTTTTTTVRQAVN